MLFVDSYVCAKFKFTILIVINFVINFDTDTVVFGLIAVCFPSLYGKQFDKHMRLFKTLT